MAFHRLAQARIDYKNAVAEMRKWRARDDGSFVGRVMAKVAEWNATVALERLVMIQEAQRDPAR